MGRTYGHKDDWRFLSLKLVNAADSCLEGQGSLEQIDLIVEGSNEEDVSPSDRAVVPQIPSDKPLGKVLYDLNLFLATLAVALMLNRDEVNPRLFGQNIGRKTLIMELESFFSFGDHLEKAGQCDNTLGIVSQLVDFEGLHDLFGEQLGYGDNPRGGHPPFDPVAMTKLLILQIWNNLSDAKMEQMVRRDLLYDGVFRFSTWQGDAG